MGYSLIVGNSIGGVILFLISPEYLKNVDRSSQLFLHKAIEIAYLSPWLDSRLSNSNNAHSSFGAV
ncbi:hypothetical protein M918_01635 [Clostridium sp. BL8]|nr:hypothetical protein M918_01635 [Clostridium sp. BL8]